nr:MAG TPA: hypothetical protein [Caudoviricetes sp.]DAP92627.1 MAG TPA: hypothetical protein [Bacteriophage sp.]DAS32874.1 MAG TPA: hypothetical protein [Caudoviricetes sp.]DAS56245.1 MAG TPA: hypothetical protein [Caudoviricetes sp.]
MEKMMAIQNLLFTTMLYKNYILDRVNLTK